MRNRRRPSLHLGVTVSVLMAVLFCHTVLYAETFQGIKVQGQVTAEGESAGLPGASVTIKGTTIGTVTDADGRYELEVPDGNAALVFSYIGFVTQEIALSGQRVVDIVLRQDMAALEEVVVIGYGTQKKVNLTGAVAVVDAEKLGNRPVASVEEALQGQVPGLKVVRTGGQPGNQEIDFQVRGTSTFSANPVLIVIDGIPSASNQLSQLNPHDIDNISVLKDAASAAIYGSRATGGVILVTTKTGKSGKPKISYNGTYSLQRPTRFPKKVSALDHALMSNEARANDGNAPKFSAEQIAMYSSPEWKDHDWFGAVLDEAMQTNHNVNISGGNEHQDYYFSLGYLKQDGIVINTGFERFNLQLNQNIKISDKFKFGFRGSYAPSKMNEPAGGDLGLSNVFASPATSPIKTDDGRWIASSIAHASKDGGARVINNYRVAGNFSLDYKIIPNLTVTGNYGVNSNRGRSSDFRKKMTIYDEFNHDIIASQDPYNRLTIENDFDVIQNVGLLANYLNTSFEGHKFTLLGGVTAEWFERRNDFVSVQDFLTEDIHTISAGSKDPALWSISGGAADWSLLSVISRATYSFQDKYLFEAALRYDGSSRFVEDLRWGLFPSASAGWVMSQEGFLQGNEIISFLKLRGSWGQVGNQNVGFYPFANTLSQSAYYFNGIPQRTVGTAGAPNPLLTWETKEAINFGIEGNIFNSLLEFSLDVFKEKTHDILLQLPLPTTFGQAEPVQNAGRIDNSGWELELQHRHSIGDIRYGVSFQVSEAKNKVIDMGGISPRISGNTITEEGHPMNEWFGIKADGKFQSQAEVESHASQNPQTAAGDLRYVDINGDNVINSEDRVRLGRSDPRYPYGVRLDLGYKNFTLTAFGQGLMKHMVWSNGWTANNFDRENSTLLLQHLDRWTPETPNGYYPKTRMGSGAADDGINDKFSSFWLEDASYFRLKHVELGYNVPSAIASKVKMSSARVFVSGENLLTITNYLGFDPELPTGTASRSVEKRYPLARVLNVGVNLTF